MNTLLQKLQEKTNFTTTENDAITHSSSLSGLVDFFGLGGSLRTQNEKYIISLFAKAFAEDKLLALKILFYLRDVREGQGERNTFRVIIKWLGEHYPDTLLKNLHLIPEFGRWDDLFVLENTKVWVEVLKIVNQEWNKMLQNQTPSLFAKWCPSINTSSAETRRLAKIFCEYLGLTQKQYRKTLAKYREELRIVESKMCANKWKEINYSHVPSKASLIYKDAFLRHDTDGYTNYLQRVKTGETKINASVTYPYEIVERILERADDSETLDLIWDSLPNYMQDKPHKGIVVADVSGSMYGRPISVSISLALYFAERNTGEFANTFITFSHTPELVKVVGNNIREKVLNLSQENWSMNTDLQAVFDLILDTALEHNIKQEDMPESIYIVSDMEFDAACPENEQTNYDTICKKYKAHGYEKPNLIFWNVDSKNIQTPIVVNEQGTCLVSGCSPVILQTLLSSGGVLTCTDVMLNTVQKERYNCVTV